MEIAEDGYLLVSGARPNIGESLTLSFREEQNEPLIVIRCRVIELTDCGFRVRRCHPETPEDH